MCLHACVGMTVSICMLELILSGERRGVGITKRGSDRETHMYVHSHTHTQMCYWRCKNQCSARKAFQLLVLGVRLPSVAFNYSLRPRPEEPHWFSFSPPQRSRQIERLDLSVQSNTGWAHKQNAQSYFSGVLQKQSLNSHWSKCHGERG